MHLRVLKRHFEIVDLDDWISRCDERRPLPPRACAITFDDGWKDNYDYGFPVLSREQVPATIFLVADFVGGSYEFWPNRLARMLLRYRENRADLPRPLADHLREVGIDLRSDERESDGDVVEAAIAACKRSSDQAMVQLLDSVDLVNDSRRVGRVLLDQAELKIMLASGMVRFGSHTRRHTRLVRGTDNSVLCEEIVGSRNALEALTEQPVRLFCYPNGDYSPEALMTVRANYAAAVTTRAGWNCPDSDRHLLRRLSIHEDVTSNESAFMARLAGLG